MTTNDIKRSQLVEEDERTERYLIEFESGRKVEVLCTEFYGIEPGTFHDESRGDPPTHSTRVTLVNENSDREFRDELPKLVEELLTRGAREIELEHRESDSRLKVITP